MVSSLDICNKALQQVGTRTNVAALNEGSWEANNFNLIYDDMRTQILRMAPWNFARKTANLQLIKAAPGTPESAVASYTQWASAYPAPPWLYEYLVPLDCVFMRYILPQSNPAGFSIPLFSTTSQSYSPLLNGPPQPFAKATDLTGVIRAITGINLTNPLDVIAVGHGFLTNDSVLITSIIGTTQLNNRLFSAVADTANSFLLAGENGVGYTPYVQDGIAINLTQPQAQTNVILADVQAPIATYNMNLSDLTLWEPDAIEALIAVCAAALVNPLSGESKRKSELVSLANEICRQARVTDANEGWNIQESVPDWITARGGDYALPSAGYIAPWPGAIRVF